MSDSMSDALSEKPRSLTRLWHSIRSFHIFKTSHDYMPLGPLPNVSFSTRYRTIIKIAIGVSILAFVLIMIAPLHPIAAAREHGLLNLFHDDPIPNIAHFVFIKSTPSSTISFHFSDFLAIYSSILYLRPTKVYIHTDFTADEIQYAALRGSRWTRKLMNTWPDIVMWDPVQVPNYAGPNDNQRIDAVQHKSDFIRWDTIAEIGGAYMDFDVITLKPLTPLLNAGFAFVAGRQYGGKDEGGNINGTINNGAFLTKPKSAMAMIMKREQHAGFNGRWEANLKSMTKTAEYLVSIPNQVLILDRHAFAPTHWFPESTEPLFVPNDGDPSPVPLETNATDPIEIYDRIVRNRRARREWEMDFSASYMLHAFSTGHHREHINPRTILSRTSNYGIATYPIVKAMLAEGLIDGTEGESYDSS